MTYRIIEAPPESKIGYQAYGAAATLWSCKAPEVIISGPYETGKTLAALFKLHVTLSKYPGARALMVRKTYASLIQSAVVTYEKKVLPYPPDDLRCPVDKFGGEKPEFYDYPNKSRLVLGGMDPQHRGRTLSAEYDLIYVNQAEELTLDDWQALTRAATGRAGNMPYSMVMGDCNPDVPHHWIKQRQRLLLLESRHEDNPTLFDQATGQMTEQGKRSMATLDALTGVRYKRGRLGLWVSAEGQVYDNFDPAIHVIDHFLIPESWPRYRSIDFGYTNPFSCSWWAVDPDGRLYRYRQIYMTGRTVRRHHRQIHDLSKGERIITTVADHDAEDRATLAETFTDDDGELVTGIHTDAADKRIKTGIEKVANRLQVKGDGRARLFFLRDSLVERDETLAAKHRPVDSVDEMAAYVWPKGEDGKPNKEVPIDADNHGLDETRYMVMYLDQGEPTISDNPFYG